jgi:hypothetical protein
METCPPWLTRELKSRDTSAHSSHSQRLAKRDAVRGEIHVLLCAATCWAAHEALEQIDQMAVEFHWPEDDKFHWVQDDKYVRVVRRLREF